MSLEFVVRIIGMIVLGFGGLRGGVFLADLANNPPEIWALVGALVGALFGLILTPHFTTRPIKAVHEYVSQLPMQQLISGVAGLVVGLIIAALLAPPLAQLPSPYGEVMPLIVALALGWVGASALSIRRRDFFELVRGRFPSISLIGGDDGDLPGTRQILLDTSVIIDGRISDLSKTGF